VTTFASTRRADYGMTYAQCGDFLIAPEWSEYVSERVVINLWTCAKCGCEFETEANISANTEPMDARKAVEMFFSSLLVA